ncbi:hypothetical protein HDU93_005758, partial [Gonapodya sp. JEL0774]
YLMDLETKSTEDGGKVFEKLILERDFLRYVKSTFCVMTAPQRTPKSKWSEIHVVEVDHEVSIEVPKACRFSHQKKPEKAVVFHQAKVPGTQDRYNKQPDVTSSEDKSDNKDDKDGDGGEEGKEEEKDPEPPKPEPRSLRCGRQVPTED